MAETTPGGRYVQADGRLVNANGEPLTEAPTTPTAAPPPVEAPSARWNKAQLAEHATRLGLTPPEGATKAELLDAIHAATR